jgi:hypothetical protein
MTTLIWLIGIPIIVLIFARLYEGFVGDFSPDKKRRKQAKEAEKNYQIAVDKYLDWWFGLIWKIIKFIIKWIIPVGFVSFFLFLLFGGEINNPW